jgi:hypothetical protein
MRIINVSADINSQKNMAVPRIIPLDGVVQTEVYEAGLVELKEEEKAQEAPKKIRKTKRVRPEEV